MGGGLMQLVAYGAQDVYLTSNAQITFFKVVYRRHTNFAMEDIEQTFNGSGSFGTTLNATISRNGDLITKMYLTVNIPAVTGVASHSFRWLNWLGHIFVKNAVIEIGGQQIDKHYGEWLHLWNELTQTAGHQAGYANLVGNVPALVQPIAGANATTKPIELYIPLQFWFCRNPGLALPLIALQYHEVKVKIETRTLDECIWSTGTAPTVGTTDVKLWVKYIYLDTDERRRFAQISHEYLIEQLQHTGGDAITSTRNKVKLNFNHPVKEFVWVIQRNKYTTKSEMVDYAGRQWFNYTDEVDFTQFSGTPSDPYGGGMGTAAWTSGNFPYSLPFATNAGSATNANFTGTVGGLGTNINNTEFTFSDLFQQNIVSASTANITEFQGATPTRGGRGWAVALPVIDGGENPVELAKIQLNGHDRFAERTGRYFNLVQPLECHTNCPATGINVYSFALSPEEHQPSGSCNFSRIDTATLNVDVTSRTVADSLKAEIRVYAVNYNVLRIMSGMAGTAFAN